MSFHKTLNTIPLLTLSGKNLPVSYCLRGELRQAKRGGLFFSKNRILLFS